MKILVGGGAGFIGSVLVPMLQEHGYEVDVRDLLWFGNHLPEGTSVVQGDLLDVGEKDLEGYEQVIFLAGLSNDPMAEYSPVKNFVQNGALPSYLAFASKKAGVRRFIYASSCSIYGYTANELYDENAPVTCGSPYGISKLQGERGVLQLQDSGFSTIALRLGTVCGHSPRMRFDLIVNTMFRCAVQDGVITVNNPSIWRPLVDVRDVASAFLRAVQADYAIHGAFNIACDNFTVGQVAELVKGQTEALMGGKVLVRVENRQDYRNYKVTCEKARTLLGFTPKWSVSDTVRDLHGHRAEYGDFKAVTYYNIEAFKRIAAGPCPGAGPREAGAVGLSEARVVR